MSLKLPPLAGPILLVGAGKMGGALLEGWLARGFDPAQVVAFDPHPPPEVEDILRARAIAHNPPPASVATPGVVVLAVKPQTAPAVLPTLAPLVGPDTCVVSVMAGRTIRFLEAAFPPETAVIRTIPNTPAAIGRGITVAVANAHATTAQRDLAHALLSATGRCEWVRDEALMDAVTAVSGSGPAYVFLLAESLAKAGVAAGLPRPLAEALARATVAGSGELLHRSELTAEQLRQNVTSPAGTTAAALSVLMAPDGLDPLMERAVAAATRRSKELAG